MLNRFNRNLNKSTRHDRPMNIYAIRPSLKLLMSTMIIQHEVHNKNVTNISKSITNI